uniref:C2H2-type domain-containing protein n=1 Tax=Timema genevievae TaxID=629358 RepID=A0A7R9JZH8_TIMGE|nr:unnamed protein product [Timema genevievae]
MNASQYGNGGHEAQFQQDVNPLLQQFTAKATAQGAEVTPGSGLVVVGNDGVRYHCTTAPNQQFNSHANTLIGGKQPNDNPCPQNIYASVQPQETTSNAPHCYDAMPQKADAATMTEKENEPFFNSTNQLEKTMHQAYSVQAVVPTGTAWQSLAGPPGSTVAEYLSRLPASTLPITLHHFLKFSASSENVSSGIKKEDGIVKKPKKKRKYKKKPYIPRPPRPRPGEIRLTTALDGSTLYCCPECHMAYPERDLLEQHLAVHKLERRFVCDICGAALKRKEHLDRHKQGHNPDRPYVCTVCLKAFKRNEHLSRHVIIHSGDKNQVCTECGKGFYRKDHLRKHTQSHIAKRLRAELVAQKNSGGGVPHSMVSLDAVGAGVATISLLPVGATVQGLSP